MIETVIPTLFKLEKVLVKVRIGPIALYLSIILINPFEKISEKDYWKSTVLFDGHKPQMKTPQATSPIIYRELWHCSLCLIELNSTVVQVLMYSQVHESIEVWTRNNEVEPIGIADFREVKSNLKLIIILP